MRVFFLIAFWGFSFMLFTPVCQSETPIRISDFLSGASTDDALPEVKEILSFLEKNQDTPFLNELEFRLNVDEFDYDRQEVAVRYKIRSFGEMRDLKKLALADMASQEAQYGLLLNRALKRRYDIALEYLYSREMISAYGELTKVCKDRLQVLKRHSEVPGEDPLKLGYALVEAENDQLDVEMEIERLKDRSSLISHEIQREMGTNGPIAFENEKRVNIDEIEDVIRQIANVPAVTAAVQSAQKKADLAAARYTLEKTQNGAWFSFIETAYDVEQRYDFDKAFSIGFGISVPIGTTSRPEMREKKRKELSAKRACKMLRQQKNDETVRLSNELQHLIRRYERFHEKMQSGGGKRHYHVWQGTEGADPMILLKIRGSMLKKQIRETKLLFEIFRGYTNLLDVSGKLLQKPLRKYLTHARERFEFHV
jgi:hypothetical protein